MMHKTIWQTIRSVFFLLEVIRCKVSEMFAAARPHRAVRFAERPRSGVDGAHDRFGRDLGHRLPLLVDDMLIFGAAG